MAQGGALAVRLNGRVAISGILTADRILGSASATGASFHNPNGVGLYAASDNAYALEARSTNSRAVDGEDVGNGIGIYGASASGYAGYFNGYVAATSFTSLSDKNVKTHFAAIDSADILERISHLTITSWDFKTDLDKHHVGPMAQDFHALFHLDGDDDKHINLGDMAGLTLAAVQELNTQIKRQAALMKEKDKHMSARMTEKDAQIAELKARLAAQTKMVEAFSTRMTALESQGSMITQIARLKGSLSAESHASE